jgi:hypothetical protein
MDSVDIKLTASVQQYRERAVNGCYRDSRHATVATLPTDSIATQSDQSVLVSPSIENGELLVAVAFEPV